MKSTENKKTKLFYGYIIVAACTLIMMFTWGALYTFGIYLEPLIKEFNWSRALTTGALSISLLITGILNIAAGKISDRYDPKFIMISAGIIIGAGFLLMSLINALWQIYVIYIVIIPVGMSATFAPVMALISRWFVKKRAFMTTIAISGFSFGTAILPQIAIYSINSIGWRSSYIILGIAILVIVVVAAMFLKQSPGKIGLVPYGYNEKEDSEQNIQTQGATLKEAIRNKYFWIMATSSALLFFCYSQVMVNSVIHMIDLGISNTSATNVITIISLLSLGSAILFGLLADRFGNRKVIIGGMVFFFLGLLILPFAKTVPVFYTFAVIFGFAFGCMSIIMTVWPAEIFGLKSIGLLIAIFNFCATIGESSAPFITSYIYDIYGSYQMAFIICIIFSLVSLVSTALTRNPKKSVNL